MIYGCEVTIRYRPGNLSLVGGASEHLWDRKSTPYNFNFRGDSIRNFGTPGIKISYYA